MSVPTDTFYSQQWYLYDTWGIRVGSVWDDYTGDGIRVADFDDGIQASHPDLDGNYDLSLDYNAENGGNSGLPIHADDNHGTAVAGLIAAERDGQGIVGVAYDATLVSIYQDFSGSGLDTIVNALNYARPVVDVMNNSWGFSDPYVDGFNYLFAPEGVALKNAVDNGRAGLGLIVLQSAGNDGDIGGNTNYHDFAANRFAIAVGATDRTGVPAWFTSPGSSVLVAAPGEDIFTTDRTGSAGYNTVYGGSDNDTAADLNYTDSFGGTSASTPIVSAVVALMLDANPQLGWRDVQEILAYSARLTSDTASYDYNGAHNWNGGGLHFSDYSGAGLVDAHAAVRLAETWTRQSTSANELLRSQTAVGTPFNDPLDDFETITRQFTINAPIDVQHVELDVENLTHTWTGDLKVELVSPSGMHGLFVPITSGGFFDKETTWTYDSVQFWGESGVGTWTLSVTDGATNDNGQLGTFVLRLYGTPSSADDLYIYTDEFAEMVSLQGSRATLWDSDGGVDTINTAAVTTGVVIDLAGGSSTIDGHTLSIAAQTIEQVLAGDGNDRIAGNTSSNLLDGGRGADTLTGADGSDALEGGPDSDLLYGGAAFDWLVGEAGADTLYGGDDGDVLLGDGSFSIGLAGADVIEGGAGGDYANGGAGNDRLLGQADADWLEAGDGNDQVYGGAAGDFLDGQAGDDTLFGEAAADAIFGGAGNDTIRGGDGADAGDDWLFGDDSAGVAGNDLVYGEGGADVIFGGAGNDLGYGGDGSDYVDAGLGNDTAFGGIGDDFIVSGQGNDLIDGAEGNDVEGGDLGDDTCRGGAGDDAIWGGAGADTLRGGPGADFLYGGGPDLSSDIFIVDSGDPGWDVIGDFEDGVDRISFSGFGFSSYQDFLAAGGFVGSVQTDGSQVIGVGGSILTVMFASPGAIGPDDLLFS